MTLAFDCTTTSIRFSCRKGSRRLRIGLPGMPLGGASSQVVLPDGSREDVVWTQGRRTKGGMVLRGVAAGGSWTLCVSGETNARGVPGLRLAMSGSARRGRAVAGLAPFVLPRLPADHVLVHGRSADGCRALVAPHPGETITSHCLLMVRRGEALLQIAQPLEQDHPSLITGRFKGSYLRDVAVTTPFEPEVGAGSLAAESVSLFADADGHALMEAWAEAQAPETPRPELRSVVGWNSWDYYQIGRAHV